MGKWKPIETWDGRHGDDVLLYRADAGIMFGFYGSCENLCLTEREQEEIDEESYYFESWWAYTQDGVQRLEGDEVPTKWSLPQPPAEGE